MKSSERGEDLFELLNSLDQGIFIPLLSSEKIRADRFYANFESPLYQKPLLRSNIIGWPERIKFPSFYRDELSHYLNARPACGEKIKIVLVANNKYRGKIDLRLPLNIAAVKGMLKNKRWQRELRPNFKDRDIAIRELSKYFQLDIYGKDWSLLLGTNSNQCGVALSKYEVMSNYNVSICYENIDVDQYITEKVPQSIMLGLLPIVTEFQKKYYDRIDAKLTCTVNEFLKNPKLAIEQFFLTRESIATRDFLEGFTYEAVVEQIRKAINERHN